MIVNLVHEKVVLEYDFKPFASQLSNFSLFSSTSIGDFASSFKEKVKGIKFSSISCYQVENLPAYAISFPSLVC